MGSLQSQIFYKGTGRKSSVKCLDHLTQTFAFSHTSPGENFREISGLQCMSARSFSELVRPSSCPTFCLDSGFAVLSRFSLFALYAGVKVSRLDMYGEKYKPFKGVKYLTKAGKFQVRTWVMTVRWGQRSTQSNVPNRSHPVRLSYPPAHCY